MTRRSSILFILLTWTTAGIVVAEEKTRTTDGPHPLRFGVISDVHLGFMGDENQRLDEFAKRMTGAKVDFIIQLGDFCPVTKPNAKPFIAIWNQFSGPRYHVLGNHEMDATSKPVVMQTLGMKAAHYGFDVGDFHGIVLDPNFVKNDDGAYTAYAVGNQRVPFDRLSHIPPEQIDWLRRDLAATKRQVFVFSHQELGHQDQGRPSVANQAEVRQVLEEVNRQAGFQKVVACFAGHLHEDRHREINGIHYIQINSSSYFWLGEKYGRLIGYKDALYALVTVTPDGVIEIQGRQSTFLPPTLDERGVPAELQKDIRPAITSRTLHFTPRPRSVK